MNLQIDRTIINPSNGEIKESISYESDLSVNDVKGTLSDLRGVELFQITDITKPRSY